MTRIAERSSGSRSLCRSTLIAACVVCNCVAIAHADPPSTLASTHETQMDSRHLIDSFANNNSEPQILGTIPDQRPLFSDEFDWKEQERVLKVIEKAEGNIDGLWHVLIDHLDDRRYCVTLEYDQSVRNHSIGEVCRMLLRRAANAAYISHIPKTGESIRRLETPDGRLPKEYTQWWRNHRKNGLQLYEIQIVASKWAADRINALVEGRIEERKAAAEKVQKAIDVLRSRKLPVIPSGIFKGDSGTPYSRERARAIGAAVKGGK